MLIALLLCLAVALGADALGSSTNSVQGASQLLVVPQLLLFMLSTGIAPEKTFPEWLRPYVRNQPVSQVAETLRGMACGHVAMGNLLASLAWCRAWFWSSARSHCDCRGDLSNETTRYARLSANPELGAGLPTPPAMAARPAVLMGSLVFPICLLLAYEVVLDQQVHKVTGVESVYGLVPVCAVLSALFGSLGSAVGIAVERETRLLTRFWVLPVHRASTLIGRLAAEAIRALIGTILITVLGMMLGLRFAHGWLRYRFML